MSQVVEPHETAWDCPKCGHTITGDSVFSRYYLARVRAHEKKCKKTKA